MVVRTVGLCAWLWRTMRQQQDQPAVTNGNNDGGDCVTLMAKKRKSNENAEPGDPLGKLMNRYGVNLGGVLIVSGIATAIGAGLLAYGLTREEISLVFSIIGGMIL